MPSPESLDEHSPVECQTFQVHCSCRAALRVLWRTSAKQVPTGSLNRHRLRRSLSRLSRTGNIDSWDYLTVAYQTRDSREPRPKRGNGYFVYESAVLVPSAADISTENVGNPGGKRLRRGGKKVRVTEL